jgi:NADH:ubiquinone oxidoreductase subunit 6 (subunit J)
MPDTVPLIPFAVLSLAVLGGALMVILSRNVVHAAFWLLEVMVAIAGLYLLLSAEFIALVQLMVYAGAVAVLTLFVVMLTLRRREDAVRPRDLSVTGAALALAVGLGVAVTAASLSFSPEPLPAVAPGIARFGELLFTRWALPFEIASVILLIALVGAVWWSGGEH